MTDELMADGNNDGASVAPTRRDAIVKLGVAGAAGAAVWMAPTVLSRDVASAASGICQCNERLTQQWTTTGPVGLAPATGPLTDVASGTGQVVDIAYDCIGQTATFSWTGLTFSGWGVVTPGINIQILDLNDTVVIPHTPADPFGAGGGSTTFTVPGVLPNDPHAFQITITRLATAPAAARFTMTGLSVRFC